MTNELRQTTIDEFIKTKHNPEYNNLVPIEIFDIEDSDEIAEMWINEFGQ